MLFVKKFITAVECVNSNKDFHKSVLLILPAAGLTTVSRRQTTHQSLHSYNFYCLTFTITGFYPENIVGLYFPLNKRLFTQHKILPNLYKVLLLFYYMHSDVYIKSKSSGSLYSRLSAYYLCG